MGLLRIITIAIPCFALRASRSRKCFKNWIISSIENWNVYFCILLRFLHQVIKYCWKMWKISYFENLSYFENIRYFQTRFCIIIFTWPCLFCVLHGHYLELGRGQHKVPPKFIIMSMCTNYCVYWIFLNMILMHMSL